MTVQLSLFFRPYQIPPGVHLSACNDVARAADDAGLHSITFGDHMILGPNLHAYPYGAFLHRSESEWPEPLTTLSGMAAVTKNLILSTGILLAPLRSPLLLAKTIATLDKLSRGRTQLALGVGWQREEYDAMGIPWEERYQRLDEGVAACRAIWGEQPIDFESENVRIHDAWSLPRPEQARIPLLYGLAMTPKNAIRMARFGDGWCPVGIDARAIREGVDRLSEALQAEGRDLYSQHIKVALPHVLDNAGRIDVRRTVEAAPEYLAAGATIVTVSGPPQPQSMGEIFDFIKALGKANAELQA
jgi:probable F420-dependent oxidoreductase